MFVNIKVRHCRHLVNFWVTGSTIRKRSRFPLWLLLFLNFLFLTALQTRAFATIFPEPESRGVWVTGNYLQGGSTAIETLVENVKAAHLNIIYIDVWYHGSTIYPSKVVSDAGGPLQNPIFAGSDPLRTLIDIAHKNGIEVFAWFEWGFWVGNSSDSTKPPGIIMSHPDWAMVQRDTLKHFIHDAYGYEWWVDPAVNAAANFIVNLHEECAERYPDIDGIEMDRMRYPDNSLSYSDSSRIKFMKETGGQDPLLLTDDDPSWSSWRAEQVTNVMKMIYQSVKGVNPTCVVSCAVWPPYGMQGVLQQWDVWAKKSYVDILEAMLYLPTSDFPNQMQISSTLIPNGFKLNAGIGTDGYGAGPINNVITEVQYARSAHAGGEVFFYYGSLSQSDLSILKDSVYHAVTLPSYDDLLVDNWMPGVFALKGSWVLMNGGYGATYRTRGGYGPTYYTAAVAPGNQATYTFRILRSGNYT
ncbi:MAG: glycoside hydrolase family 10 protein, partial [Candidatus Kryptoniota bacterium]